MKRLFNILLLIIFLIAEPKLLHSAKTVDAGQIKTAITDYVQKQYNGADQQVQTEWIKEIPAISMQDAWDSIAISHRGGDPLLGSRVFHVKFLQQQRVLKSIYVPAKIHVFQKVWVTDESINRNSKLEIGNLRQEEKDISLLADEPLAVSLEELDLITKRRVSANQVLLKRDVREEYLVVKGSLLDVEVTKANLTIKLKTQATQNGWMNDIIWVKNLQNRQRFKVKLTGPETAVLP